MYKFLGAVWLPFMLACAACTPNISPNSYTPASVGQVDRTVRGTILSGRLVDISGTNSGIGAGAGAVAGGLAGSRIGGNSAANAIAGVGGAVVGGIIGATVENAASRQNGMEYVIQTENGALLTIVQSVEPQLQIKQRVLVIYGTRSRVIADPS